jgi:hypothetical protein
MIQTIFDWIKSNLAISISILALFGSILSYLLNRFKSNKLFSIKEFPNIKIQMDNPSDKLYIKNINNSVINAINVKNEVTTIINNKNCGKYCSLIADKILCFHQSDYEFSWVIIKHLSKIFPDYFTNRIINQYEDSIKDEILKKIDFKIIIILIIVSEWEPPLFYNKKIKRKDKIIIEFENNGNSITKWLFK